MNLRILPRFVVLMSLSLPLELLKFFYEIKFYDILWIRVLACSYEVLLVWRHWFRLFLPMFFSFCLFLVSVIDLHNAVLFCTHSKDV